EVFSDLTRRFDALPLAEQRAVYVEIEALAARCRATVLLQAHQPQNSDVSLDVVTTKALAERWRMPEAKIRDLCRTGCLPAKKLGPKEWVISVAGLRAWLPRALAEQVSPGLISPRDPGRGSQAPQAARPYTVEVRRPARRPQNHGRQVGS